MPYLEDCSGSSEPSHSEWFVGLDRAQAYGQ